MNLSMCTISFRHQLISLDQIANWAQEHGFQGIELWGVHAKNLRDFPQYNPHWLKKHDLKISMISDYLPLGGDEAVAINKIRDLCQLARFWGVNKIRTFAGDKASTAIRVDERRAWALRLRRLCDIAFEYGIYLVIETHPNSLADTLDSTLGLIEEVNHSHLKINFDVIHVWEANDDPQQAFIALSPYIVHMHLKNIQDHSLLNVFQPANVYAPAGQRQGMVSVFDGALDFSAFLRFVLQQELVNWRVLDTSLEWFGEDVLRTLEKDKNAIEALQGQFSIPVSNVDKQSALAV